tara:strand:+ start:243 stop:1061 length:819 start_codon:yes stop_codon:yes gene_type:complete
MSIIHNYCITGKNFQFLEKLNLNIILSGSEDKNLSNYPSTWIKDNDGINISKRNKNFGTLTSHYWLWKNKLDDYNDEDWIGINHYRRFWLNKNSSKNVNISNLSENILREVPTMNNANVLLPNKIVLENLKLSKFLKKGFQNYIRNPLLIFSRKKISIKLHFDLFHGYNLLPKAAELLNDEDKSDFKKYIIEQYSFYPLEIFISKKRIIKDLYSRTFDWIFKCEEKFANLKLEGYGKERLYDFLAERYFSFYFEKYTSVKTWPYVIIKEEMK